MAQERIGSGKLVLITGCTGGIGKATAIALARHGYSIAVHYHKAETIAADLVQHITSDPYNVRAAAFQADLSTYDGVRKLHADVVRSLGHPDVLFNNTGILGLRIGAQGSIQSVSAELFEETWRTNIGTHYLLTQLCLPHMEEQKWGRIVFTSSVAAGTGGVIGPHYASSKSAMHVLVHWLANRYAKEGITANAVAPALIAETGMMLDAPEHVKNLIPIGRLGRPEEIADIVELFVNNAFMTNKIIVADGGLTPSAF